MTPIQQQRLIGGILLVCVISAIAFFLINGANQGIEPDTNTSQHDFNSVVEPISDNVEVLDYGHETLIDSGKISNDDLATAEIVPSNNITVKPTPVQPEQPAPIPAVKPITPPVASKPDVAVSEPQANVPAVTTNPKGEPEPLAIIDVSGWLLQLGVFSVKSNAQAMQKQVATLGYDAKIEQIKTEKGSLIYKVRIGPEPDKTSVEKIADRLNKELKLKTQIVQQTL